MVGFTSRRLGIVHLFVGTGLDRLSLFILGQEPMGFMSVERAAYQKPRLRRLLLVVAWQTWTSHCAGRPHLPERMAFYWFRRGAS